MTDCDFNKNTAGSAGGGVVYIMVDLDTADAGDGGILKLSRWGRASKVRSFSSKEQARGVF